MQTKASPAPFLTIGTRGSPLARAQAEAVRRRLAALHHVPVADIAITPFITSGDRIQDRPLSEAGGKGLFTKEIEAALIEGAVDLAVHSAKDLETFLPEGLVIGACLTREDVRDALISRDGKKLDELPRGAKLGTSSIRRAAQMLRHRADLTIVPFRGNVGTRLKKLADGIVEATLLAAAGLNRLGEAGAVTEYLDPEKFPPAPGQGVICVEIRQADNRAAALVAPLADHRATTELAAERAFLAGLDGSCRTPIGAYVQWLDGRLRLTGEILSPDGKVHHRAIIDGPPESAVALGRELAAVLRAEAGDDFFAALGRRWQ
ncbi:MAG: hydroxymethylbilane synthase [Cucumibacter sp.]